MVRVVRQLADLSSFIAFVAGLMFVVDSHAADFHRPRVEPEEMIAKVEAWLEATSDIQLPEYVLSGVSFDYVQDRWRVFYECSPISSRLGCHFGVTATNAEAPDFMLHPGL
jgi:hypothetical protein